jgi:23S rRNA pseudouridine1911/1915/1917 synthase
MSEKFAVSSDQGGLTLAAVLRRRWPGRSWSQVRRMVESRRIRVGGLLCQDPARRLSEGEEVEALDRPVPVVHVDPVLIRYLDEHLVVVEKPTGIATVRHPAERDWPARRKALNPVLDEIVASLIAQSEGRRRQGPLPRLRVVQRLDKETSGLVVFARTVLAERHLGKQFRDHSVTRRYLAVVPGQVTSQRIATRLVRDRGDGRRGSTRLPGLGKEAVTHMEVVKHLPGHSLLSCRLETGRTHQIRIHLAELGHPVCGEQVYGLLTPRKGDTERTPRLALHATELGFIHPVSGKEMHWTMPLPADLQGFVDSMHD